MKYYIELTLIDFSEMPFSALWSKLYIQLHLAMVEMQDSNNQAPVGVNFPEYKVIERKKKNFVILGSKLRLFAKDEATLAKLKLDKWLERLTDYIHIRSISSVPEKITGHLIVSRYHFPPSPENIAKRYATRHGISFEDALERLDEYKQDAEEFRFPYIQLKSLSGNKNFNLFISQKLVEVEKEGAFSTYGLSSEVTVPHW